MSCQMMKKGQQSGYLSIVLDGYKLFQAEKELYKSKRLQLSKQQEKLAKIKQRCFVLKQKDAEFSVKVLEKEEEMQAASKTLAELHVKRCSLQLDLNALEHRQKERLEYYNQRKSVMNLHQCKLQDNISNLKAEVNNLREAFLQLEAQLTDMQNTSSAISHLDAEIGKEERRKNDMLAQINALEAQAGKNCIIKFGLDQRVQQTRKELEDRKTTLEKQRSEVMELQSENQSLENRVLEAIQIRDQRRRSGFGVYVKK